MAYMGQVFSDSTSKESVQVRFPGVVRALRDILAYRGVGPSPLSEYSSVDIRAELCAFTCWVEMKGARPGRGPVFLSLFMAHAVPCPNGDISSHRRVRGPMARISYPFPGTLVHEDSWGVVGMIDRARRNDLLVPGAIRVWLRKSSVACQHSLEGWSQRKCESFLLYCLWDCAVPKKCMHYLEWQRSTRAHRLCGALAERLQIHSVPPPSDDILNQNVIRGALASFIHSVIRVRF